ncbi:MAG: hypothetical protein A2452_03450 [Candidatus Firestonebacteria bacterium RIFOXYC2_FULL_39_67]|nr:MAG: hypothetical protein A2536_02865 [Candidatus Firestonebacteria bacterium RIFOXYD2_FULL_39_29]OGF55323.1 MAG: hypothetical protein A2452_03450 [Candidatus Firestonebacteria bacterium RIFOXYC2_FULL_39_67]
MFAKAIVDSGLKKHGFTSDNITPFQMKKIINEEILPKLVKFMKGVETLEALGVGQIIFDVKKNILFINASFKRLVGLSEAVESKDVIAKAELEDIIDSILKGEKENIVKETELKTSKLRLNIIGGPVKNAQKEITGVVFFFQDNTMRAALDMEMDHVYEKLEEKNAKLNEAISKLESTGKQLRQSEKMAAVGQLAGGVAHEINNPLTIILGYSQAILKKVQEDDPMYKPLKSIENATGRCKKIVSDLLAFSRTEKLEKENIDINEAIDQALTLVQAWSKVKNVEVSKKYSQVPQILTNKNQIQQVIVNLCNNAVDAMPSGGIITITTKQLDECIEISVADTGKGMSEDVKHHIFEPFFTTKDVGKGTGLGLSLCHGIITRNGGTIQIISEMDKGTNIVVKLPITQAEPQKTEQSNP